MSKKQEFDAIFSILIEDAKGNSAIKFGNLDKFAYEGDLTLLNTGPEFKLRVS